jgi:molybdopterin molybdotransferase
VIGFDEALALVAGLAKPLGAETVTLAEARGRVLAAPVIAMVDSPPADVSAMDGYAVRDADLPGRLGVAGESFPGGGAGALGPGQCIRIFTGGPVPEGADRVVIQEDVTRDGDVATFGEPGKARHIRRRAGDFARGDVLLTAGMPVGARALVAAAGADLGALDVWRRPRLVILGTGDELAEPGPARDRPGAIPESLSLGVAALAEDMGAEIVERLRLCDDLPLMEKAATEALAVADLVVVTGGASVGEKDFARAMFAPSGLELIFSKVAIKPGKPVWLGRVGDRLVMGLPGNPTSAMVTARLLLAPLLAGLGGRRPELHWRRATLAGAVGPCGERETFVRAAWDGDSVRPFSNQDSGAQKTLADADLLIRRRAGAPAVEAGETVEIIDF